MHKRIAQMLAGATDEYEYVDGTSAVSYTASEENSLYNIRIYGNAEMIKGAVGALSSTKKNYELYVRIHGKNFLGGNELVNCAVQNLNEKFEYDLYGNQLTYTFHSITSEDYITVPNQPAFKENTVYTVRFRYTGIPNSSTGIKIRYTDGYEEDILSSDEEDSAIAFTTVMGKTVSCIAPSDALPDWGMIYLNTFGIFEGKTGYDYFEEYNAQTYTLKIEQPLAGIRRGIKSYYDVFDWKTKESRRVACCMEVGKSRVYLYDASYDPLVVMIQVPDAIDTENPVCEFDEFIYCSSYDQILGDAYCYTFLDSKTILLSLSYGTNAGNYEDEFEYTKRMLIYKKESEQYTTESSCPDIPSVSRGYVGIEVWGGNIPPTKIKVCYKK